MLFLGGSLFTFIGFSKGHDIAASLSKPVGESAWTTSNELILGCVYTPVISGIFLIIMSVIFSTIIFTNWVEKSN